MFGPPFATMACFERQVAIKFLPIVSHGPVALGGFLIEGSVLARLDHPNICRLLDAGFTDDEQPDLVIEWGQGKRIDATCVKPVSPPVRSFVSSERCALSSNTRTVVWWFIAI